MHSFKKHIIVFGSARSGTSWLSETMSKTRRYRMLFEPDHPEQTKKGNLLADQFLSSRKDSNETYKYLKSVFKNRIDCNWIAQNSNRSFKRHLWPIIPKKFVIKFIRVHLGADYIANSFRIPMIYIKRNPYDVITSQHRVKFPWLYDLSIFKAQLDLKEYINDNYDVDLDEPFSDIESLAVRWSIENIVSPSLWNDKYQMIFPVSYDDINRKPDAYINLCDKFGLEYPPNIADLIHRPSSKTHPKSHIRKNSSIEKSYDSTMMNTIDNILDKFNYNHEGIE